MRLLACTLVLAAGSALAAAAPSPGPLATIKQKNNEVDKLLRLKPEAGSPAEKKQKDEIKSLAGTLLDYGELARRAMADHWNKLTAAQRDDFVANFRRLIEARYVKQIRSSLDYQIQYKGEEIAGDEATVPTVVKVKTKGKSTDAEIVYKLRRGTAGWMVYDIVTDEVSLVRNFKVQFHKIITEKSYDELIKTIQSKTKTEGGT